MHSEYSKLTSLVGHAQLVGFILGPANRGFSIDCQLSIPCFVPECTPSPSGSLRIMANSFCIDTRLKHFML